MNATPEDIRAAYRLILGREPDRDGFENYLAMMRKRSLTPQQLGEMFMNSAEFLAKHSGLKVDMGGGVFVVVDPTEPEFGSHIAEDATWEPHVVDTIKANLFASQVFVDVGANVGIMSFNAARIVGPHGKVIAFEPNQANARLFLQGVLANNFQRIVRLHRLALSDRSDLFALQGGSNTHLVRPKNSVGFVQSLRGDEVLANEQMIHFIKLDIEGHEPFAISRLLKNW